MQKKLFTKLTVMLALTLSMLAFSAQAEQAEQQAPEVLIEKMSPLSFDDTIARLKSNAKALGWKVPKKWFKNFQKNLKHVTKVDIGKGVVIEMCEPFAAVELLVDDEHKKMLAMMPCTIAIYEKSDGKVYVSMMNMRMMSQMFPGKKIEQLVDKLAPQMDKMLDFE